MLFNPGSLDIRREKRIITSNRANVMLANFENKLDKDVWSCIFTGTAGCLYACLFLLDE